MKQVYAYVRVSTVKQGEKGSSLQEQKDAISVYAGRHGLVVVQWFEEMETAAKRGRRIFTQMLSQLRKGPIHGVVIHKIDRGARNLRDWADLAALMDEGIDVHFAHESLDLSSRGGRLSADIQAVVAADYVRNLRDEVLKGFYGRLKQGLYPLPAPPGYKNMGKGLPKEPDPRTAPFVRTAFELYATATFSLEQLREELLHRGFPTAPRRTLSIDTLSRMLNNPFYIGIIRIRRTNETFPGIHEPLISKSMFDRVQAVLRGKTNIKLQSHDFLFRRLMRCEACGYAPSGERQKGHIYYRCHSKPCAGASIREEAVAEHVEATLRLLKLHDKEMAGLENMNEDSKDSSREEIEKHIAALHLRLHGVETRISRLMDAFLDGVLDRSLFEDRKKSLLFEKLDVEEKIKAAQASEASVYERISKFLELLKKLPLSYKTGNCDEKREILKTLTSNLCLNGKNVVVELRSPYREIAEREISADGGPSRDELRTGMASLYGHLVSWSAMAFMIPEEDLPALVDNTRRDTWAA